MAVFAAIALLAIAPQVVKLLPAERLREDWWIVGIPDGCSVWKASWVKWLDRWAVTVGGRIYVTPELIAASELTWRQTLRFETVLLLTEVQWGILYLPIGAAKGIWALVRGKEHPWRTEAREYAEHFLAIDSYATGEWPEQQGKDSDSL